ncbi:GntR family transcriptional regulator [Frondihabitans cladoniiphilus]|uniref:GntR family transcriptional regulator n=1 Tax=Frondihabitans cladoniiphilus TaxID=715785 RepID=A0ABP8W0T4_9MICO
MEPSATPARTLLRERVHGQLLKAILDGTFQPGARLRDSDLTAWLGTSRAPIREALAQLTEVGVIEMAPNRYTRVATITPRVYAESAAVWATLMTRALHWGILAFPADEVPRLAALCDELRTSDPALFPPGPTPIDRFLGAIARHCSNAVLLENIAVHEPLLQLGINRFKTHLQVKAIAGYFDTIVARCVDHDVDGFEAGMREFLNGPTRAFTETMTGMSLAEYLDDVS